MDNDICMVKYINMDFILRLKYSITLLNHG